MLNLILNVIIPGYLILGTLITIAIRIQHKVDGIDESQLDLSLLRHLVRITLAPLVVLALGAEHLYIEYEEFTNK